MKKVESSGRSDSRSSTMNATTRVEVKTILPRSKKAGSKKGNSLEDIAAQIDVNPKVLKTTIERWNELYHKGQDDDHKRPPKTMLPIANPPFYVMEAWPIVSGPEHDVEQQVLDPMKKPIPRLYVAGEISSIYGHL